MTSDSPWFIVRSEGSDSDPSLIAYTLQTPLYVTSEYLNSTIRTTRTPNIMELITLKSCVSLSRPCRSPTRCTYGNKTKLSTAGLRSRPSLRSREVTPCPAWRRRHQRIASAGGLLAWVAAGPVEARPALQPAPCPEHIQWRTRDVKLLSEWFAALDPICKENYSQFYSDSDSVSIDPREFRTEISNNHKQIVKLKPANKCDPIYSL